MESPLVSIVTPSYNQAPFLEECIRSVLNQDYQNLEYIIIDGGSTDGSLDIIQRYADHLTYWESVPDKGQADAINKGFFRSRGDIVAWINSDDVYFPGAVSAAVRRFQEKPGLALFYGNCVFIGEKGNFIRYFTEVEPWNMSRLLNFSDFIMQPTTFFTRDKLVEVGYLDESLHYGMDWDLWCKLAKMGDVHYEQRLIAANREYGNTKTNSGNWVRLKELLQIQRRHMTGLWPHAFFGYCGTQFRLHAADAPSYLSRFFWRCASRLVVLMAPVARCCNRRLDRSRNLYGFQHHSGIFMDCAAQICLPLRSNAQEVDLRFKLKSGVRARIETPDKTKEIVGDGQITSLLLPVGEKATSLGRWEAKINLYDDCDHQPPHGEVFGAIWVDGV